jgi:hypothetical protein
VEDDLSLWVDGDSDDEEGVLGGGSKSLRKLDSMGET